MQEMMRLNPNLTCSNVSCIILSTYLQKPPKVDFRQPRGTQEWDLSIVIFCDLQSVFAVSVIERWLVTLRPCWRTIAIGCRLLWIALLLFVKCFSDGFPVLLAGRCRSSSVTATDSYSSCTLEFMERTAPASCKPSMLQRRGASLCQLEMAILDLEAGYVSKFQDLPAELPAGMPKKRHLRSYQFFIVLPIIPIHLQPQFEGFIDWEKNHCLLSDQTGPSTVSIEQNARTSKNTKKWKVWEAEWLSGLSHFIWPFLLGGVAEQ